MLPGGGNFESGFLGAMVGSVGSYEVKGISSGQGDWGTAGKDAALLIVGGTVSQRAGGNFANGALSTAFQLMFNDLAHQAANKNEDNAIHKVWLRDSKSASPRHACNYFVEDVANKFHIHFLQNMTASEMVRYLGEHGYTVNMAAVVTDASSGKYFVIAGRPHKRWVKAKAM